MNVLRVIASMNPSSGGPCEGIRNSIPELAKLGVSSEVLCLDDPSMDFLKEEKIIIHALGPASNPWNYSAKLLPWLLNNLERFDAVIVHGLWLHHGYAVRKAVLKLQQLKKNGKDKVVPKIFIMPHGMLDPYFQQAKGRGLKAKRNWLYWKLIEGKIINSAEAVLFTCKEELLLARKTFRPYFPKQEINIGYGIATPPVFTEKMRTAFLDTCKGLQYRSYILYLARIHEKKGVHLLVQAYKRVFDRLSQTTNAPMPAMPALVIAGPGMDSLYGKKIQQMVDSSDSLKSSVFFPGMLTKDAKWGAFYGCEAYVLPSFQENFGIAVAEALACGKPVLITNKINIWREIEDAQSGIIAEPNEDGITTLLESWIALPAQQKLKMGENARNLFEESYDILSASKQLINAIS